MLFAHRGRLMLRRAVGHTKSRKMNCTQIKMTKTDNTAGHLGWHNQRSTAFQQWLRTIENPFTHRTHTKPIAKTVRMKQGYTTGIPPVWMKRGNQRNPPTLCFSLPLIHTQSEGGVHSECWHLARTDAHKALGTPEMKEKQGGGQKGGWVATMPFLCRQPVEQGAKGEEEQNERVGEEKASSPAPYPLLFSMWRSVCSARRSASAGRGGAAAPQQNLVHNFSAVKMRIAGGWRLPLSHAAPCIRQTTRMHQCIHSLRPSVSRACPDQTAG